MSVWRWLILCQRTVSCVRMQPRTSVRTDFKMWRINTTKCMNKTSIITTCAKLVNLPPCGKSVVVFSACFLICLYSWMSFKTCSYHILITFMHFHFLQKIEEKCYSAASGYRWLAFLRRGAEGGFCLHSVLLKKTTHLWWKIKHQK